MNIESLEKVRINDSDQWILVRGKSGDAPLLIHVQAGPGLPMIPEADTMEKMLHLEDHYLVAYWDQRGCGKSFSRRVNPASITLSHLSDDIISCTAYLLRKYGKREAVLVGYSLGATTSLMAAATRPDLFNALFAVGTDVDIPAANLHAIEFARQRALESNNGKMLKLVGELQHTPIVDAKRFQQRARLLTDLGGITRRRTYNQLVASSLKNMFFCKSYTIADIAMTIRAMAFCQNALLPELDNLNLFHLITAVDTPVHFVHGRHDGVSPCDLAHSFFLQLQSKQKDFTTFDDSAHMPHYDEPEKFANLLIGS